jgi:DNA-directed RNA polymerase specialized sigma24 family protein
MAQAHDTALHHPAGVAPALFGELYEAGFRRVWRLAARRCPDRQQAEALTTSILERAFREVAPEPTSWLKGLFQVAQHELRERGF